MHFYKIPSNQSGSSYLLQNSQTLSQLSLFFRLLHWHPGIDRSIDRSGDTNPPIMLLSHGSSSACPSRRGSIFIVLVLTLVIRAHCCFGQRARDTQPIRRLQRAYGRALTPAFSARLYAVHDSSRIVGHGHFISLAHAQTVHLPQTPMHPFSATLNGRPFRPRTVRAAVHSVRGYTVATVDERVRAVWGNGLQLFATLPAFPDVLVDHSSRRSPTPFHRTFMNARNNSSQRFARVFRKQIIQQHDSCRNKSPQRVLQVAIAFDNYLCARFQNDPTVTATVVRAALYAAERAYVSDTCVLLNAAHIEAHCKDPDDPYRRLANFKEKANIVRGFRNIWVSERAHIARDVAYFFPGFWDAESGYSGIAWVGGACRTRTQYGYVENIDPYVTAHEIGHSLNASHIKAGLMNPNVPANFRFAPFSISQIVDFVDAKASETCLQIGTRPAPPPTPPASPSRSPRPDSGYCSYLFDSFTSRNFTMACKRTPLRPNVEFEPDVSVQIVIDQKFQGFHVILIPPYATSSDTESGTVLKQFSISGFSMLVSTGSVADSTDPFWRRKWNYKKPGNVVVRWPASQIRANDNWISCCDKDLYIHLKIRLKTVVSTSINGIISVVETKAIRSAILKHSIYCDYCDFRIIPMSPSKKCPRCTRR